MELWLYFPALQVRFLLLTSKAATHSTEIFWSLLEQEAAKKEETCFYSEVLVHCKCMYMLEAVLYLPSFQWFQILITECFYHHTWSFNIVFNANATATENRLQVLSVVAILILHFLTQMANSAMCTHSIILVLLPDDTITSQKVIACC